METQESTGLWWLSGHGDRQVAGTLRIAPTGVVELELIGTLGDDRFPPTPKQHPVILGSVEQSPGGNRVTLTGCVRTGATFGTFVGRRETYRAEVAYLGDHLSEPGDFLFDSMSLTAGGLAEWIGQLSGFEHQTPSSLEVGSRESLGFYKRRPPAHAELDGATIEVGFGFQAHFRAGECVFRETAQAVVSSATPITADEFRHRHAFALRALMTFVGDREEPIERLTLRRPGADHSILVVGEWLEAGLDSEPGRTAQRGQLFTLADIDFAAFYARWMRLLERHEPACNVYFGLLFSPPAFIDLTFQAVLNALQLYHAGTPDGADQRARNERRYHEVLAALSGPDRGWLAEQVGAVPYLPVHAVLRSLLERHGESLTLLLDGRPERLVDEAVGTLDHVVRRDPELEPAANQGADLYWLTQKLRFVLKACLLHEVDFPPGTTHALLERDPLYRHLCQVGRAGTERAFDPMEPQSS